MTETLLFFVAVLAASIVVMWCERTRLERQIACLQDDLASERSSVSRQMIELAEVKADAIRAGEQFATMQTEMRAACLQVTKERDQIKKDYDYVRNALWEECETSSELRHSRAVIIEHCRKLKRELANEKRAAEHLSSECYTLTKQYDAAIAERDHARKLMDETRERCGAEIDVLEETVGDFARKKADLYLAYMLMRQSRQKIIDHCRLLKRSQKDLRHLTDYILDELTTINTSR